MIDENAAPSPKPNVDIVSLSPSSEQYFLFSRVDGKLTVGQLCQTSGLGRETTLECLRFLARVGAVDIPGYEVPKAAAPTSSQNTDAESPDAKKTSKDLKSPKAQVVPNYPIPPEAFEFDAQLLAVETPLDDALRRELICLHEQLEKMSYYDLFGLRLGATKKEIKRAYFRLSKRHHPDNFFRQDLGRLGEMQETVFKEIARAYTTLSKKRTRKEYDAALEAHLAAQAPAQREPQAPQTAQEDLRERNKRKAVGTLLVRRAEKLEARGHFSQAAEEYRKALALTRDPELAMRVAARMLDPAKLPKEAASFARAALKLGAPVASARFVLGCAMQAAGAKGAAIQEFQKVLEASPEHPGALERLGELERI